MKKLLISFYILFGALNFCGAQPSWTLQNPYPTYRDLLDVQFLNTSTGYVIGKAGTILRTDNSGVNWTIQSGSTTKDLNRVFFINVNTGWIVGEGGTIQRTTDGGTLWSQQTSGTTVGLNDVQFLDANTGTVVGDGGLVLRTTDGGTNWLSQTAGTNNLDNVLMVSSTIRLASGIGGIQRSVNSGGSWTLQLTLSAVAAMTLKSSNTIWAYTPGNVFKSVNSGANWTNTFSSNSTLFSEINFFNANTGLACASNGIYKTTDGGGNWTTLPNLFPRGISCVLNTSTAYIVGAYGSIMKTTNMGNNWDTLTTVSTAGTVSLVYLNSQTGLTAGENGIILRTTNQGEEWKKISSGVTQTFRDIHFFDENTGYVVGVSGTILRSTNGGLNWINQSFGTVEMRGVFTLNKDTAVVTSLDGAMWKTTNAGVNWNSLTTGVTEHLDAVYFINQNTGIVAGASGRILKTTNGGNNWTAQTQGSSFLSDIYFLNNFTGFIVGQQGKLYKTTNTGTNWTLQTTGTTEDLNSIHFFGAAGIIGGNRGILLSTENAGANWTKDTISGTNLTGVFMNSSIGNAVGDVGTIMRSTEILPVELSSFISSVNKQNVILNWSTVMEENNLGFDIERKSKGSDYIKLAFISGAGNSNFGRNYNYEDRNLTSGKYKYRLKQIDYNGSYKYYDLNNEVVIGIPNKFSLSQNYPNPFNPNTVVSYHLPVTGFVSLKVFDIAGKEVALLVNEVKEAGYYSVEFDARNLPSGTYFYKLQAGNFNEVKKMVVVK